MKDSLVLWFFASVRLLTVPACMVNEFDSPTAYKILGYFLGLGGYGDF